MGLLGNFLGSTLGAVGGKVGSGLIDGFVGDFFNKKQEQRAFDRNVEMWNMENQYNSPQEQMKRYKDAGLNPNLVYGSLGGSTNIGSVGMANNSVDTSNSNYANPYYHYMNIKNRQYEDAVKNQQLAKMENENKLLTEKIENEKNKRNPPKTIAENEGGVNQLKGKNNHWDKLLNLDFKNMSIADYGRVLKDTFKTAWGLYKDRKYLKRASVLYDRKSGKYYNVDTGELYD